MDSCSTFSQFLQDKAILSQRQAEKLAPFLSEKDQNQSVFKLADFFRSLTPSDNYDLALRLYLLWTKESKFSPQKQNALQKLVNLLSKSLKRSAFHSFIVNTQPQLRSPSQHPKSAQYNSFSPADLETKSTINFNSVHSTDIFSYLHNEAQKKNSMKLENEQKKLRLETENCTFQPNLSRPQTTLAKSSTEVFERLQQDLRKEKELMNSAKKVQIEMRDCTFKPTLLTKNRSANVEDEYQLNTSPDRTFERLYREHHAKRHATLENELKRQTQEVQGCTFQPSLTTRSRSKSKDPETDERFKKLYKLHSERQRSLMKKRIEKAEEEEKRYSFRPQLISSPSKSAKRETSQDVKDRLWEWNNEKKKRLEAKLMEKFQTEAAMSQEMNLPTKKRNERHEVNETNDSISAYERLYQDSSHKKIRKEILEKKVLKELGASFTPKTNLNRNLSARKLKENASNTSSVFISPGSMNFSREGNLFLLLGN